MSVSLDVPQTQNTAPVLEYRCLWTSQIRKKVKSWQDGKLKFHTFNKRVMVYDERANFVGDTHWREDSELEEGEELELDRGGILVQVAEYVEKKDQDLTELMNKRVKEREGRAAAKATSATPTPKWNQGTSTPAPHLRPKPLNTLLTPSGHYGRAAIPNTSPFEERQTTIHADQDGNENDRPTKRRRPNESTQSKNGYAQNLMGTSLTLSSSKPSSTPVIRHELLRLKSVVSQPPSTAIDLTMDDDEIGQATFSKITESNKPEDPRKANKEKIKAKRHKPAPKAGYASQLTGVALSLSTPQFPSAKRSNDILLAEPIPNISKTKHMPKITAPTARQASPELLDSSMTMDEDSFLDIDSSMPPPPPKPKESAKKLRKPTKKKDGGKSHKSSSPVHEYPQERIDSASKKPKLPATRDSSSVSRSSSPARDLLASESRVPTCKKPNKPRTKPRSESDRPSFSDDDRPAKKLKLASINARASGSTSTTTTPESSTSSLRIKPRAPRGMMMLMGRPSPRPSLASFGNVPDSPQIITKVVDATNEPPRSQATMELDSFCRKYQERQKDRENGKRSFSNLDLELSSSPEELREHNSGSIVNDINHHKIDLLLSREPSIGTDPVVQTRPLEPVLHSSRLLPGQAHKVVEERVSQKDLHVVEKSQETGQESPDNVSHVTKENKSIGQVETPIPEELGLPLTEESEQALPTVIAKENPEHLLSASLANDHDLESTSEERPEKEQQGKALESESIPIAKPKCTSFSRSVEDITSADISKNEDPGQKAGEDKVQSPSEPKKVSGPCEDLSKEKASQTTNDARAEKAGEDKVPSPNGEKKVSEPCQGSSTRKASEASISQSARLQSPEIPVELPTQDHGATNLSHEQISKGLIAQAADEKKIDESSVLPRPNRSPPRPSKDITDALKSAADHFRAMVKVSTRAEVRHGAALDNVSKNSQPGLVEPTDSSHALEKLEQASSKVFPAKMPEITPAGHQVAHIDPIQGFRPANEAKVQCATPKISVPSALNKTRLGQTAFKPPSAVRRGKSIQAIVVMTDVVAQTFNGMGPAVSRRPPHTQANDVLDEGSRSGPVEDVPPTGPWSREAFDLFGSWRPPRATAAASMAN
ncbi:hypothetical protein B0J14DRAFT_587827 [Halenospora varia]|nr:hypothetical protein B0J14DRAFT_587827 [Halenospora varia]